MKELIKIRRENGKQLVNARELHEFLDNKRQFADWIKQRIQQYGFIENEDFTISQNCEKGGRPTIDYAITVDMAKELSMVENNEKGKQARKYFIECEKQLKEVKQLSPMQMLELQLEAMKEQEQKINVIDTRVIKLENTMTIDYGQQLEIKEMVNKKVVMILGGKDAPAYKELNKKAFSSFWKDYKRIMKVNSYRNTSVKDLTIARRLIMDWKPSRELELMIIGCNSQKGEF